MRFGVLGPLHATVDGNDVAPGSARQAKLLAALLLDANRVVPMQRLVEVMWDDAGPATAVRQVQDHVSGLRRRLTDAGAPAGLIATRRGGYRLQLDTDQSDLLTFEHERALAADRPESPERTAESAAALRRALACWRGPALADLPGRVLESEAARLDSLRTAAHKQCLHLELTRGRHREVVDELTALLADHPLDEGVAELAMIALYRSGRQSEALDVYQRTRRILARDIGVDPAPPLQQLHGRILAGDPRLAHRAAPGPEHAFAPGFTPTFAATAVPPPTDARHSHATHAHATRADAPRADATHPGARLDPPRTVPRQLTAAPADFSGRAQLAAQVRAALDDPSGHGGPVVLSALAGAGGVGKTTLALHVAHSVLDRFPDGQLLADLHGVGGSPADPGEVLARFLRALGVPAQEIPADPEERGALYRSTVAGRRVLVLLDNVKDAAQVRPLLPGSGSCAVLVTSRTALPGLDGVHRFTVDVMTSAEALELFTRIVGPQAVAAEPDAVQEVLRICAGLPLAIRIAASRLACQPGWTVRTLADRLQDEDRLLDELHVEDRAVRASFAVGYAALPQPAARVFRLLGTAPGPTISLPAAVALADGSRRDTEDAVWTLLAAHLLQPVGSDRYRFHDLVRVYAAELAGQRHTEQRDAVGRLLRWCLHTADHASRQLVPGRAPAVADGYWGPGNLPAQASRLSFDGYEPAQAWFDTEKQNLAAAVQLACAAPERALLDLGPRLVWAFWASPYVRGDYDPQWEGLCAAAVRAAQDLADPAAEASARKTQGVLSLYGGRAEEAVEHFEEALAIRTRLGDTSGAAACAVDVACAYSRMGRHDRAINGFRAALDGYRRSDERTKVAILLNNLGIACHRGGDSAEAVLHLEESLQIKNELGDVAGQSKTLTSLVEILYGAGRAEEAAVRSAEALSAVRRNGSRETLALVLEIAVRAHRACGRGGDAERHREELDAVRASLTPEQRASLTAELLRVDTPSPAPAPAPAPQERDGRTVTTAGGVSR